jgi:hypothetical protein
LSFAGGTSTVSADAGDVLFVRGDYTVGDDGVKAGLVGSDLNGVRFGSGRHDSFPSIELGCATFTPGGASPPLQRMEAAAIALARGRRAGLAEARRLHLPACNVSGASSKNTEAILEGSLA